MIAYTLVVEMAECAESPEACLYAHHCNVNHRKFTKWVLQGNKINTNTGAIFNAFSHFHKNQTRYKSNANTNGWGWTGNWEVLVVDTDRLKPLWGEAEHAAHKLGGIEAVKKLQKGLAKEERDQERARLKAEKEALKPKRGKARTKRLDAAMGTT